MKKFLFTIGIGILSLVAFVGCGINTKALENASSQITSIVAQIQEKQSTLDDEANVKCTEIANEIKSYSESIDFSTIDSQEKIDEITAKYEEQYKKLKDFADENGIEISEGASEGN